MTTLRHLWLPLAAAFRLDRRAALLAFLEVLGAILSNLLPLAFGLMVTGVVTRSESTLVALAQPWPRSGSASSRSSRPSGSRRDSASTSRSATSSTVGSPN